MVGVRRPPTAADHVLVVLVVALLVSAASLPPCQRISLAPAPRKGVRSALVASFSAAIANSAPVRCPSRRSASSLPDRVPGSTSPSCPGTGTAATACCCLPGPQAPGSSRCRSERPARVAVGAAGEGTGSRPRRHRGELRRPTGRCRRCRRRRAAQGRGSKWQACGFETTPSARPSRRRRRRALRPRASPSWRRDGAAGRGERLRGAVELAHEADPVVGRCARDHAVEQGRIALHVHQRLAAAVRAAFEVRPHRREP